MALTETTRTFLGVFPPAQVIERIARAVEALRRPDDGVGWVRTENVHYTLRFLGDLEREGIDRAMRAASRAARESIRFTIRLGAPGVFPHAERPRVLWLGAAEGGDRLTALARGLEKALQAEGFGPADKPFAPHLTLGRVRERADGPKVASHFMAGDFPADRFDVAELVVVKSTLDPRGARYEPLDRWPLAAPGPAEGARGHSVPGPP